MVLAIYDLFQGRRAPLVHHVRGMQFDHEIGYEEDPQSKRPLDGEWTYSGFISATVFSYLLTGTDYQAKDISSRRNSYH